MRRILSRCSDEPPKNLGSKIGTMERREPASERGFELIDLSWTARCKTVDYLSVQHACEKHGPVKEADVWGIYTWVSVLIVPWLFSPIPHCPERRSSWRVNHWSSPLYTRFLFFCDRQRLEAVSLAMIILILVTSNALIEIQRSSSKVVNN